MPAKTSDTPETTVADAVQASTDRKARLAAALDNSPGTATAAPVASPASELAHIETHLQVHGLSIADLLRTVAKNFHGVTVPPYSPKSEG
jgi:predicted secreted Zn-dependent protease